MNSTITFPEIYQPLETPYRYKVSWGGRAAARSWTFARMILLRALRTKIRVLCTRELQKSIKQSVHKLLSTQIDLLGWGSYFDITDTTITSAKGSEIIFFGVKHNTEEIRSMEGIDICWIEEGHSLSEASWDLIDPTIRREGSEIWITYNTRFKYDFLHKLFVVDDAPPGSWVKKTSHRDNPYLPEVLRRQMEALKESDHEKYLHIWEGEYKRLAEGAIFGKQISEVHKSKRLTFIPVQKNSPVYTFSDLGKKDATGIWFMQHVGKEFRFIDYFEGTLEEVEHYTRFIKGQDYLYGDHYLPHDADHDRLGMKRNIREQFEDGGVKPVVIVPRIQHKSTAIQLAREVFPSCWFHRGDDDRGKRMERGYDALCQYRYRYHDEDDVFGQTPHHDWASNGADAFLQFAQGYTPDRLPDYDPSIKMRGINPTNSHAGWMGS